MTNTKIDLNTVVGTSLRIIADEWEALNLNEKRQKIKKLLLNPTEFLTTEQIAKNYSFKDWMYKNEEVEGLIRYEMKQVLLDVLYEYAGEYAKRKRPDSATGNFDDYQNMMVKFWADVPQTVKATVIFGDCLIFSLETGLIVTYMESKTAHGDDDSFTSAMNQIMNHHQIEIGQYYCVNKVVSSINPLNKQNPNRVAQIKNFIGLIEKYVINAYDNDKLNANVNSTDGKPTHIFDAWIDEQGIDLYCCNANMKDPASIYLPINDILGITADSASEKNMTYTVKMAENKTYNIVFSQSKENK